MEQDLLAMVVAVAVELALQVLQELQVQLVLVVMEYVYQDVSQVPLLLLFLVAEVAQHMHLNLELMELVELVAEEQE